MKIKLPVLSPAEVAENENQQALLAVVNAKLDYVAMMCDIDIPTEEEENEQEI